MNVVYWHIAPRANAAACPQLVKTEKVVADICQRLLRLQVRGVLAQPEQQHFAGFLQERDCIADGATAFASVLPCHQAAVQLEWRDGVRDHQNRPARSQQNHTGIHQAGCVGSAVSGTHQNEIGRPGLTDEQVGSRQEARSPFDVPEPRALLAKLLAQLIEHDRSQRFHPISAFECWT
jgi:hypothetical protein